MARSPISPGADAEATPPREGLGRLFLRFLRFGFLAWGGPVAQIAMIRRELVEEERWLSSGRFNRVLAVYQALPGPEAHELCVHFGMLARGRAGGLLAGLGFMLPGFVLMFALSWFYVSFGIESPLYRSVFAGLQAAVLALIVRAIHRIGAHALHDRWLWAIALVAFVCALLGLPFVLTLGLAGATYLLVSRRLLLPAAMLLVVTAAVLAVTVVAEDVELPFGEPVTSDVVGDDVRVRAGEGELLVSGLRAGLLTFGGAYTAIPVLQHDAVTDHGWMTNRQFLDGVALSGTLPAPLIIFSTFVGYVAGTPLGAVAITIGVFLPAFAFTLLGHRYLEWLVERRPVHAFLDGVTAGVVGLIAASAVLLAPVAISSPIGIIVFTAALGVIYVWTARSAIAIVMVGSGLLSLTLIWVADLFP